LLVSTLLLGSAALVSRASAFDPNQTFAKGTFVLSAEGSYGEQFNLEGFKDQTDIRYWNAGLRASFLPFGAAGPGFIRGAFEIGLEPLYQRYLHPRDSFWAGLMTVVRYHFLALGRFVPYAELGGGVGETDLHVTEIDSNISFLLWGGVGVSLFVTDAAAIYAGYRYEHNSNAHTNTPNRGVESHVGVFGVSYYFR
jgi:hypothetical protein